MDVASLLAILGTIEGSMQVAAACESVEGRAHNLAELRVQQGKADDGSALGMVLLIVSTGHEPEPEPEPDAKA